MATHPEFSELHEPVDLEAEEVSGTRDIRERKLRLNIGDMVRFGKAHDSRPEGVRGDIVQMEERKQWRIRDYDDTTDTYTLEFVGEGNGTWGNVPREKLEHFNPDYGKAERDERIRQAMEKSPGDTVN